MHSEPMPLTESLFNYLPGTFSSHVKTEEEKEVRDPPLNSISQTKEPLRSSREILQSTSRFGSQKEKSSWSDENRPFIKLRKFEDLVLNEEEQNGKLSDRMIGACLSYLEKSPANFRYVLCKCVISDKDISNLSALEKYHFIRYLDLSKNNLTSLVHLGQMPFLEHLDVSDNFIKALLDFKAPFGLSYVDYTNNELTEIPDLSDFWSISHLNLSRNEIKKITGLENLRFLTYLDISHNLIKKLQNLNGMRILHLELHHNLIDSYERGHNAGLHTLLHLCHLNLSHNSMKSLKYIQKNYSLESLNMSYNNIKNLSELNYLNRLPYLARLDLSNNPIATEPYYFNICIRNVQQLQYLDDTEITAERKINAKTKQEIHYSLPSRADRMELLLLQQINKPRIRSHIVPYDQPPPKVIILVGPPCSRKNNIAAKFVATNDRLVYGRSHTTRTKTCSEVEGKSYFFVSRNTFEDMVRKGEFSATSEFNGHLFGIAITELQTSPDSVKVFHTDINAAVTLKVSGISPILVLAIPSDEKTHLRWLKLKYIFERSGNAEHTRIQNSPVCVRGFPQEMEYFDYQDQDDDGVFEVLETSEDSNVTGGTAETETLSQEAPPLDERHIFNPLCSSSMESDEFDVDDYGDRSTSLKSYTGILKTKPSGTKDVRSGAVSFTDTTISAGERLGSKRVSFNWLSIPDDGICEHSRILREPERSISDNCILVNVPFKSGEHNLLSVLSATKMAVKPSDDQETEYMTFSEHFEQLQMEKLGRFYEEVKNLRTEYLKIHWENPGLFRAVIFTDNESDCLRQLKGLLRFTIENPTTLPTLSFENDAVFKKILVSRLEKLELKDNLFVRKSSAMSNEEYHGDFENNSYHQTK